MQENDKFRKVGKQNRYSPYEGETERLVSKCQNPKALKQMAIDYYNDNPKYLCIIATSPYTDEDTLELLAKHPIAKVRVKVAQSSNRITSKSILTKLALDKDEEVKKELARRTNDQSILELLINTNRKNDSIIEVCLSRVNDITIIIKFISRNGKEIVNKFIDAIYENNNFTLAELYEIIHEN